MPIRTSGSSAAWAWHVGWHGWAVYLSAGNVVVNVYPILLQRYTRGRLVGLLRRASTSTHVRTT